MNKRSLSPCLLSFIGNEPVLNTKQMVLAALCRPTTLRSWRLRNGLFPHHRCDGSHTKYTVSDAIGIRLLTELICKGFKTQYSVDILNALRPYLDAAARGYGSRIGLLRSANSGSFELKEISIRGVNDPFCQLSGSVLIAVDLDAIFSEVWGALTEGRPS